MVLAEGSNAAEPLPLKQRKATVVQERCRDLSSRGVLGIALDAAAAQTGDLRKGPSERSGSDAFPSVSLVHKEARDSPVRWRTLFLRVDAQMLDPRQLGGNSELTPADAKFASVDKSRVSLALANALLLLTTPVRPGLLSFGMKRQAPASAPDSVVTLNKGSKIRPS